MRCSKALVGALRPKRPYIIFTRCLLGFKEYATIEDGIIRRCSSSCDEMVRNIRERSVKVRQGLPPDSRLRQQAAALSGEAKAIDQEYRQLITLPQAEQTAGEAGIRQRLEKLERAMADLESQVASAAAQKFSTEVSYGNNYLQKFRKHAEQIRRTTERNEIAIIFNFSWRSSN